MAKILIATVQVNLCSLSQYWQSAYHHTQFFIGGGRLKMLGVLSTATWGDSLYLGDLAGNFWKIMPGDQF